MPARLRRRWWLAFPLALLASFAVPPPDAPADGPASLRLLARDGTLLRDVRPDGRAHPVALDAVAPAVVDALVAVEDRHFWKHPGVNPLALVRAAGQNVRAGRVESGGSTLTMQAARALRSRARRGWGDKLAELHLALRLELHRSKRDVLAIWLNRVAFGNNTYGIEAAAHLYFGKPANDLTVAEAALLVGLPQRPTAYDPFRHPDRATARQRRVLAAMEATGALTADARRTAEAFPLTFVPPQPAYRAPHFVQAALAHAPAGATTVRTTLDAALQTDVETLVAGHLAALRDASVTQAAVLVLENATGAVRAYVGSADFWGADGQNDGVRQRRQPGSALKPFTYGLALESRTYTAATVLADVPTHITEAGGAFSPENYDKQYHGPTPLRSALANSYNVPAVRVTRALGPAAVLTAYRQAGLTSLRHAPTHYSVGLTLGNGEVSLLEVAAAYAGLANAGHRPRSRFVEAFERADGVREETGIAALMPTGLSPATAFVLTDILRDPEARAPAFGRGGPLELPFPVAVKTGTTKDYRDNWTVGYTPRHTVAVWVGNFDNAPMRWVSGVSGAGPLFNAVMRAVGSGGSFAPPPGVVRADVCPASGHRPGPDCPARHAEWFLNGTVPSDTCTVHRRLAPNGPVQTLYPPEFHAWMRARGLPVPAADPVSLAEASTQSAQRTDRLRVTFPSHGSVFHLDPVLRSAYQRLRLAGTAHGFQRVHWLVDGTPLDADWTDARWPLVGGTHRIELEGWDAEGRRWRSRPVTVRVQGSAVP